MVMTMTLEDYYGIIMTMRMVVTKAAVTVMTMIATLNQ